MLNVSAHDASILPRAAHRPAVVASTVIILLDHGECSYGDFIWETEPFPRTRSVDARSGSEHRDMLLPGAELTISLHRSV